VTRIIHSSRSRVLVAIGALLLILGSYLATAQVRAGETPGNNGTVKIHEGGTEDEPIVANDPHVCTFHLHFFFGDDVQSGEWWIEEWAPGDAKGAVVLAGDYDASAGEDRAPDASAVPNVFSLPDGHYKLFWEGATNPGGQTNIKHKVFWVACAVEPTPTPTGSLGPVATPTPTPVATPTSTPVATPTPVITPTPVVTATPTPNEGELGGNPTPPASPREGQLGGNPIPDTAMNGPHADATPALVLGLLALLSLGALLGARLRTVPVRR
jgi:hypothetical protein